MTTGITSIPLRFLRGAMTPAGYRMQGLKSPVGPWLLWHEATSVFLRRGAGYLFVSMSDADCARRDLHPRTLAHTSVRGTRDHGHMSGRTRDCE